MSRPLRVYIGWDQRDALAYEVCERSLRKNASGPVEVIALKDWELRAKGVYWRDYYVDPKGQMWDSRDDRPFSTNFGYTRFCIPLLEDYGQEPVIFCDADMLWLGDAYELAAKLDGYAVACVQHNHCPRETTKITGNIQRRYKRKNWSSVMVMRPSSCTNLTPYAVNAMHRDWLHGMLWLDDSQIIGVGEEWNWLDGWSDESIAPKVVHFTRGTPDLPGYEKTKYADEWRSYLAAGDSIAA
jgi:hypothetical protein